MQQEEDSSRTRTVARDALSWMAQRNIPPIPGNFELAYRFISGDDSELKRELGALAGNGGTIDAKTMEELRARHGRIEAKVDEALTELGEGLSSELDSVLRILNTAGQNNSAYGQTLALASGEMGRSSAGTTGIKAMIDQVIGATRTMETRSKELEAQLLGSSEKMATLQASLDEVRNESLTDALTGVRNRRAFDFELQKSIQNAVEKGEPLSLIMCDIDKFKAFNDTWGHQTGDQVLRLVAICLAENVKGRDPAARYGGEEFAIILPQTALEGAAMLADQIRGKVESKKLLKKSTGETLGTITISAGVAQYDSRETAHEFIHRADLCLYAAKRGGRNRVVKQTADPSFLPGANRAAA